jgi:lipopolysaccharide transport system permease protein
MNKYIYFSLARQILRNRRFIYEIIRRELTLKNKGTVLGIAWLALVPFIQAVTYIAFISILLDRGTGGGQISYAVYVMSGLITWTTISRVLSESPSLLIERSALIKQVIYPIETLPFTTISTALLAMGLTFLVLLAAVLFQGAVAWTFLLLPLLIALLVLFLLGSAWFLMVVGAVLKDMRDIVSVSMALLLFLSPVMLTEQLVGEKIWFYLMFNPFSHAVIAFRDVMLGTFHVWSWIVLAGLATAAILIGGWAVVRAKIMINEYI